MLLEHRLYQDKSVEFRNAFDHGVDVLVVDLHEAAVGLLAGQRVRSVARRPGVFLCAERNTFNSTELKAFTG